MPTLSPGDAHEPSWTHRGMAESFGVDAERYDRTRPHYPAELVHRIVAASPGPEVLDLGCGTGIGARQFAAAGCRVLGVEPDERMAEFARGRGTDVVAGTAETWDPAGRSFDAVIAGQAWHWVDPVAGAANAARALRPGGLLAVFWNVGDPEPAVAAAFAEVYRRVLPDSPLARLSGPALELYAAGFDRAVDGMRATGAFDEPQRWRLDWDRRYTADEWLDQLPTHGVHTRLPADTLQELLARTGAALDALGGGFTMRYATVALTAVRA